jgi:hypothetical protein
MFFNPLFAMTPLSKWRPSAAETVRTKVTEALRGLAAGKRRRSRLPPMDPARRVYQNQLRPR